MKPETKERLLAIALDTDWPRRLQQVGVFLRSLRGDVDIDADHVAMKAAGTQTTDTVRSLGRRAVACSAPGPCSCKFCIEEQGQKP